MLRPRVIPVNLIILTVGLFTFQAATPQESKTAPEYPAAIETNPSPEPLVLELDRAITVLKRGIKENWETRDQYLIAFEMTPSADSTGRPVKDAKEYVKCAIGARLRIHQMWDEGPPVGVEAAGAISAFIKQRNEAKRAEIAPGGSSNEFWLPRCAVSPPRKVAVSASIAAGMLKTRIDPVYPADVHVFGTVVLDAIISTNGRVEALRVVSGPVMLQQAALDAVRRWIYRPYRLDNAAVEVETTVNVIFAPPR